jgi:hypothetical protein
VSDKISSLAAQFGAHGFSGLASDAFAEAERSQQAAARRGRARAIRGPTPHELFSRMNKVDQDACSAFSRDSFVAMEDVVLLHCKGLLNDPELRDKSLTGLSNLQFTASRLPEAFALMGKVAFWIFRLASAQGHRFTLSDSMTAACMWKWLFSRTIDAETRVGFSDEELAAVGSLEPETLAFRLLAKSLQRDLKNRDLCGTGDFEPGRREGHWLSLVAAQLRGYGSVRPSLHRATLTLWGLYEVAQEPCWLRAIIGYAPERALDRLNMAEKMRLQSDSAAWRRYRAWQTLPFVKETGANG